MDNSSLPLNLRAARTFAIQETDTEHRAWQEERNGLSTLVYDWSPITRELEQSASDLLIEVSQRYPSASHESVKQMADGIYQSVRLEVTDRVFAVHNQSIDKVGYVHEKKQPAGGKVEVDIKWVSRNELGEVKGEIFEVGAELQQLLRRDMKKIERQHKTLLPAIYERLPKDPRVGMVDAMRSIGDMEKLTEEKFFVLPSPKQDQGGSITLFYGTSRELVSKPEKKIEYGRNGGALQYGFCDVHIPLGHIQGELERPDKFLFITLPENEREHVVVKEVRSMEAKDFKAAFIKDLNQSPDQHALLFIHGYNNSFEDAARRTAQLAWDLPFEGQTGFFSWPSSGKTPDYLADEAKARSAFPALMEFLIMILDGTGVKQLHLIAHSMGNLVLTLSVNALKCSPQAALLGLVHQIILAAPDIDQEEFRNTILPEFQTIGARRTIYASDHDSALGWSATLRRQRKRLGQTGAEIFLDTSVDTVEASNIPTENSHSYMFQNQVLLSDMFYLITRNLNPAERRLRKIVKSSLFYWLFPK